MSSIFWRSGGNHGLHRNRQVSTSCRGSSRGGNHFSSWSTDNLLLLMLGAYAMTSIAVKIWLWTWTDITKTAISHGHSHTALSFGLHSWTCADWGSRICDFYWTRVDIHAGCNLYAPHLKVGRKLNHGLQWDIYVWLQKVCSMKSLWERLPQSAAWCGIIHNSWGANILYPRCIYWQSHLAYLRNCRKRDSNYTSIILSVPPDDRKSVCRTKWYWSAIHVWTLYSIAGCRF